MFQLAPQEVRARWPACVNLRNSLGGPAGIAWEVAQPGSHKVTSIPRQPLFDAAIRYAAVAAKGAVLVWRHRLSAGGGADSRAACRSTALPSTGRHAKISTIASTKPGSSAAMQTHEPMKRCRGVIYRLPIAAQRRRASSMVAAGTIVW